MQQQKVAHLTWILENVKSAVIKYLGLQKEGNPANYRMEVNV